LVALSLLRGVISPPVGPALYARYIPAKLYSRNEVKSDYKNGHKYA